MTDHAPVPSGEVETPCATCGDRRYVRMEASFIYPADGDVGQLRSCPDCGEVETPEGECVVCHLSGRDRISVHVECIPHDHGPAPAYEATPKTQEDWAALWNENEIRSSAQVRGVETPEAAVERLAKAEELLERLAFLIDQPGDGWIEWAERYRGGDTTLHPESFYTLRDTSRVWVADARGFLARAQGWTPPGGTE